MVKGDELSLCDYTGDMKSLLRRFFDLGYECGRDDVLRAEGGSAADMSNVVQLDSLRRIREARKA